MRLLRTATLALVVLAACAGPAHAQSAPGIGPVGANDWTCRPTAAHPEPVVLVHGTFADMTESWNLISPALAQDGYCVFALDYGTRATGPLADSAREIAAFVDRVLAATGATKVSIVGHSQGGMLPRYVIKSLGYEGKIEDLIGLAPSNHGTTVAAAQWAQGCPACTEQVAGSDFLTALNAGDESPGMVAYTQIETRYDEVVVPYSSAFLAEEAGVTNVLLQDRCAPDVSDHLGIGHDPIALRWVQNALGRPGPADPAFDPGCPV
jgi:triacylglycerol lipase